MSEDRTIFDRTGPQPIVFGRKLAGSEVFKSLFREGMALVEETAGYLDGNGRTDSKRLTRAGSLAYATESMRLTTRLMQVASWLLLQRAVNDGQMSQEQAGAERAKVKLTGFSTVMEGAGWNDLPGNLRDLIARSLNLQDRVRRLDAALESSEGEKIDNPVGRQLGRLEEAFGAVRKQAG
jgi:regulator of CtrA degradation